MRAAARDIRISLCLSSLLNPSFLPRIAECAAHMCMTLDAAHLPYILMRLCQQQTNAVGKQIAENALNLLWQHVTPST